MANEKFEAVMFDLDGTLLDTLADLAASMNTTLARMGFPEHAVEAYRYHVGDGIERLARRVLPTDRQDPDTISACVEGMREEYELHWADSKPYDGIPDLLTALTERNIRLTVFSNKPDRFTGLIIDKLLPHWHFERVAGAKDGVAPKPDPKGALNIASELAIQPQDFLYVGDTDTDMKTAVAAGMFPVGVLWGFRDGEELVQAGARKLVDHPQAIVELLE